MEPNVVGQYVQDIQEIITDFRVESAVFEGEGDFYRAYSVNERWIFRFAYNSEGSQALEREAVLLPQLASTIKLNIPNVAYFGRQRESNLAFVGYPKVQGIPLTEECLSSLEPHEYEQCARDLADFLNELHSFSTETARQLGVVECAYPFCRTEDGIMQGSAADLYNAELARLLGYPILDEETRQYCKWLVQELLNEPQQQEFSASLIHGDLSKDHVLFDLGTKRITGVIDFSDAIISTPLLDYMYLYHSYGEPFLTLLLSRHNDDNWRSLKTKVQLLHGWYTALRLLWALDHDYQPGIRLNFLQLGLIRHASHKT